MSAFTSNRPPFRLSALSIAITTLLGTAPAQVSATCQKQMTDSETYTATSDCTGSGFAIQIKNVAADTLTVNSGVTLGGSGNVSKDNGGVVLGTDVGNATALSSLGTLTNDGTILGAAANNSTGVGINMYGNKYSTQITALTNNGLISGEYGILMVNAASVETLTNNSGATIYGKTNGILSHFGATGINNIINDGSISGGESGITVSNASASAVAFGDITNNGSIGKADDNTTYGLKTASNGSISTLTNTGTIYGTQDGINNQGTITTLVNHGTITGTNGNGIFNEGTITSLENTGTITSLVNGQTSPLEYSGKAPQAYYTYSSDASSYGKVEFVLTDYTLDTYGIKIR
ncbi:MAG: hypothetical protein ACTMHG_04680, partial [Marinobacter sp.]